MWKPTGRYIQTKVFQAVITILNGKLTRGHNGQGSSLPAGAAKRTVSVQGLLNHSSSALGFLLIVVSIQVLGIAGTPWDWWFEDDSAHRVFVRDHPQPLWYFSKELVSKLSLGHSVTPWFPLTFWIDATLAPLNPAVAYLHTGLSLFLTAAALYLLLRRILNPVYALSLVSIWIFLPSTVVITEFLSCRHYLEGLLFSLVGILFALKAVSKSQSQGRGFILMSAACYLLACTTKEVYVSATWFVLLCIYANARRFKAVGSVVACGFLYAIYRLWSLETVGKNLDFEFLKDYHLFLKRLPFIFSGNQGGYLIAALGLSMVIWLLWKRKLSLKLVVFVVGVIGVMLVSIFPVTANVTHQFEALGTWYRVVFLLNTFLLIILGYLFYCLKSQRLAALGVTAVGIIILWGGITTTGKWDDMKTEYRRDGKFYLEYPDRLLYSKLPAPWFLHGLHDLYLPNQPKHYLTWRVDRGTTKAYVLDQLERFNDIWVYSDHEFVNDPTLLETIRHNCLAEITPLHEPLPDPPEESSQTKESGPD